MLAKAWLMVAFVHATVCRWQEAADCARAGDRTRPGGRRRPEARTALGVLRDGALRGADPGAGRDRTGRGGAPATGSSIESAEAIIMLAIAPLHAMSGDVDRARELSRASRRPPARARRQRDRGPHLRRDGPHRADGGRSGGSRGEAQGRLRRAHGDARALRPAEHRRACSRRRSWSSGASTRPERSPRIAEGLAADDDVEAQIVLRTVRARLAACAGRADEARLLAREAVELTGQTDAPVLRADTLRRGRRALSTDQTGRRDSPRSRKRARSTARRRHLIGMAAGRRGARRARALSG